MTPLSCARQVPGVYCQVVEKVHECYLHILIAVLINLRTVQVKAIRYLYKLRS